MHTTTGQNAQWILRPRRANAAAAIRLFCLPHAGGGGTNYCTWPNSLPSQIDLLPVQLPGRGSRFRETPFTRMSDLVTALARVIEQDDQPPFVLFGHSMGALICFELARHLRRIGASMPLGLILSGCHGPELPSRRPPISHLPRSEFLEQLQARHQAIPSTVLKNPEMMRIVLPTLLADFKLLETYTYQDAPPLDCPIIAMCGTEDDLASESDLATWQRQTTVDFQLHVLSGGHFFIETNRGEVLRTLSEELMRFC